MTPAGRVKQQVDQLRVSAESHAWCHENHQAALIDIYEGALKEIAAGHTEYPLLVAREALKAEDIRSPAPTNDW